MDQRTARRQPAPRLRTNLDTDFLKLIAILSMLLDHIGAVFFPEHPAFRWVGRLAFPIFCYCMTVGLLYTRDIKKYLFRLGLFAVISQPFYVLAFHPHDFVAQFTNWNIFCTLFLFKIAVKKEYPSGIFASRGMAVFTGAAGSLYGLWLNYAAGLNYLMVACIVYAIGLPLYIVGVRQHDRQAKLFEKRSDKVILAVVLALGIAGLIYSVITFGNIHI